MLELLAIGAVAVLVTVSHIRLEAKVAKLSEVITNLEGSVQALSDQIKVALEDFKANGATPENIAKLEAIDKTVDDLTASLTPVSIPTPPVEPPVDPAIASRSSRVPR